MTTEPDEMLSKDLALPQRAEFYRRVLEEMPSPVLVVAGDATIIYGNLALERMGGWDLTEHIGKSVLDFIAPESVDAVAEAFFELAGSEVSTNFQEGPWASIHTRLVAENGQIIPVVVTGTGGLQATAVNGIIYDIRPTHEQDILRRGLTGLAHGEPIDSILALITDMVSLPPLALDAAVLEPHGDGTYRVVGATDPQFEAVLKSAADPQPWNVHATTPHRTIVSQYPGGIGEDLFAAGYREFWHVSPESDDRPDGYRIVAAGRLIELPANGQIDRLSQANELASVVLLRARADASLEHSATHDRLTKLANREGFHRRATDALDSSQAETAAMLFLDLDGFKQVNDAHGHAAGDTVLATVARRLLSVTRSIDLVARLGGDEFVILVGATNDRPANRNRVQVIAERTLHELGRPIDVGDGAEVKIAASIGAAITPMPTTLEDLLAIADAAMYEAKRAHGNRHHIVELD